MGRSQRLDNAEAQAATAVDGDARRLVDHNQIPIFMNDRRGYEVPQRLRRRGLLAGCLALQRRQANTVTGGETMVGTRASAIHPHLAGPQDAVDEATWDVLEDAAQEVVDSLPVVALAGLDIADLGRGRGTGGGRSCLGNRRPPLVTVSEAHVSP